METDYSFTDDVIPPSSSPSTMINVTEIIVFSTCRDMIIVIIIRIYIYLICLCKLSLLKRIDRRSIRPKDMQLGVDHDRMCVQ